ncbi:hypothetical protein KQI68_07235 [Peptoniphilus sp. MSJ-1]|uniref:Uncharacterized protein n=1 Tax=Peptoniphilus ovalis TaxID=2841503 RepID=A0ABS6FJF3_9FIRM|nr:hypothetical protein [Peptoniphilus ovalis]MBU5669632.1 hypothetical protein [Peptoniphilus ovalis]
MNTLFKEVKELIINELEERKNQEIPADILVDEIMDTYYQDSSIECNTELTKDKLFKYWNEYKSVKDWAERNWNDNLNPLDNIELFDVTAHYIIAKILLESCDIVDEKIYNGEKIKLTEENIKAIMKEFEEMKMEQFIC